MREGSAAPIHTGPTPGEPFGTSYPFQHRIKRLTNRYYEMKMLHVCIGSRFWHPIDVLYVVTGKVWTV